MELRHLRYFIAVAEERNFSRAARRLQIAQPPLSQQIQQLERELGVSLFDRESRPIAVTPAGEILLEQCRPLLKRLDDLESRLHLMGSGAVGALAVGFISSSMYKLLPPILKQFMEKYPGISLELRELTSLEQEEALRERSIDVGFIRGVSRVDGFVNRQLLEEPLVVAVPESWRLAGRKSVALKELRREPFVIFPVKPDPGFANFVKAQCINVGFEPTIVQEVNELQTALSLVASGIGLSLMPGSVRMLQRVGVTYLALREPAPRTAISIIYREGTIAPVLKLFLEEFQNLD
jgi:LysR family transcriptional regulator, benzoate and cis,cis-muconate-responsive activator of ben and cat genes